MAPSDTSSSPDRASQIEDLVVANHILFDHGVVDAFGHVSVRDAHRPDRFLLVRNVAPGNVTADDVMEFDLDARPLGDDGRSSYLERFIHSEIYRAHPAVGAVVHSHSDAMVTLGVVRDVALRPVFHMAGFLGAGAPVFEIRDHAGDGSDLLIRDRDLGRALSSTFGAGSMVVMRGHGSTVVADSLPRVVYRAVYAEVNAQHQIRASGLGDVTFLTPAEAAACVESVEGQVQRPWQLWKEQSVARRR